MLAHPTQERLIALGLTGMGTVARLGVVAFWR